MRDKYLCDICEKKFTYLTSLKNHLEALHYDIIGVGEREGKKWEDHCKLFKEATMSAMSLKDLPAMPKPRIRSSRSQKKKKPLINPSVFDSATLKQEISTLPLHAEHAEELPKTRATLLHNVKEGEKDVKSMMKLPTSPKAAVDASSHNHIHSEFCGDPMVVHGDHVDFIHDAELHFVAQTGAVYPHKLEASSANPSECKPASQYPWETTFIYEIPNIEIESECKDKCDSCFNVNEFLIK
eukprot:TRINITY_DN14196_c0_g7_i1.p1 TRINITY_DN14196_c0_g7~~TRINITY_DN14196_c0_g7_i1.p1  ORF type:complete len:240 (+),score=51.50 TRINITY_DN14196_c0_g7_i1:172-891(+)